MERETESEAGEFGFSLVRGGPLYRLERALRLVPDGRLGARRRIAALVALSWLPVVAGAIAIGRAFEGEVAEPLFHHFGVHARCLIAIPLLLGADAFADRVVPGLSRYFVASGLVPPSQQDRFRDALRAAERLRDSRWGELIVIGVVASAIVGGFMAPRYAHEVVWAMLPDGRLALPGIWYIVVSRPIFLLLVMTWLWRVAVLAVLFRRIARLDLQLVAIHPDRAAGLGFLDYVPQIMAFVALALSCVLAAQLGHEVLYHGVAVRSLQPLAVAWVVVAHAVLLFPLLPFCWRLVRMRHEARLRYAALLGDHAQLFESRWLGRSHAAPDLLGAKEIGIADDAISLYGAVETLRLVPSGLRGIAPFVVALLLPMLPVIVIEVPIKDVLLRIGKALV